MGSKNWAAAEVVNASDFNAFLANQVVMVFADATARDAGFGGSGEPTLAEGMVCFLSDVNQLQIYTGSAWVSVADTDLGTQRIVQVAHDETETSYLTTSTSYQDITDLSVSITPQSTSSTLLVMATLQCGHSTATGGFIRINRSGSPIALDPAAWFYTGNSNTIYGGTTVAIMAKESPASTSAQSFTFQFRSENTNATAINRSTSGSAGQVGPSTATVFEVSV